jgi:hypothetical protein
MITTNVEELLKSLKAVHADTVRRLENMVSGFAYEFVLAAGIKTPIGNAESLETVNAYAKFYKRRYKAFGIPMEVGYHRGSWQFSPDGNLQFSTMIASPEGAADDARYEAQSKYRLGQSFYIGANTPGMVALQNNSSAQTDGKGIVGPAIDLVMSAYSINMAKYYKE